MSDKKLYMGTSPHISSNQSTKRIMLDVIIALLPALFVGVLIFGFYALTVVLVCIATCIVSEIVFNLIRKKPITVFDLSAVVTGLILGLNLPPQVPMYIPIIGSVFAIIIVKMLFGGLGKNFANPAAAARVFLLLAYGKVMTTFVAANFSNMGSFGDITSAATPLAGADASILSLFLGNVGGSIGETSALALLIGGIYLIVRKVIDARIPFTLILTVAFLTLLNKGTVNEALISILSGGLMLGAFFMATDYSTSPKNSNARIVYAIGIGLVTFLIRNFTSYPEGISIAIVFMNLLVPQLDNFIIPHPFGSKKKPVLKIVCLALVGIMSISLVVATPLTIELSTKVLAEKTSSYEIVSTSKKLDGTLVIESKGLDGWEKGYVTFKIYVKDSKIIKMVLVDQDKQVLAGNKPNQSLDKEYIDKYIGKRLEFVGDIETGASTKATARAVKNAINGAVKEHTAQKGGN